MRAGRTFGMHWPTKGRKLGWSPAGAALAIPVKRQQGGLTLHQYLQGLRQRALWLEGILNPEEAVETFQELWGERWQLPNSQYLSQEILEPPFLELLQEEHQLGQREFPQDAQGSQRVGRQILEMPNLGDWIVNLLPPN